jgi:DNA-binding Xre family transcriptional regulator
MGNGDFPDECIVRCGHMGLSYKRLWKLLIDRDMRKQDLCRAAGISGTTVAKLGKGESVNTDILLKICNALQCDISDIMEVVPEKAENEANAEQENQRGNHGVGGAPTDVIWRHIRPDR